MHSVEKENGGMNLTKDELMGLMDELCVAIGEVLATHTELKESLLDQNRTVSQQQKIDRIKDELAKENDRLKKLRDSQHRRRKLEKVRKDHEQSAKTPQHEGKKIAPTMTPLLNERGVVIGWIQPAGAGRTNILDRKGRVVARELNGITLDACGRLRGRDQQGLRVLGQSMAA